MAKKKAGERELQIEITTDADWDDLLHKPGLWLVDVYRDWSGPCTSAQGSLKKYKTEVDDSINFATARADNIAALEMFRHTCEPQWVFVAGGEIVGFLRGTNISVLLKMITDLSAHERKVEAGKATRRPVKDLETLAKPERIEVVDPDLQAQEDAEEAEEGEGAPEEGINQDEGDKVENVGHEEEDKGKEEEGKEVEGKEEQGKEVEGSEAEGKEVVKGSAED